MKLPYPYHQLNDVEIASLAKFLNRRVSKRLIKSGSHLELIFKPSAGIGVAVEAVLKYDPQPGEEIDALVEAMVDEGRLGAYSLRADITDYTSW